MIETCKCGWRVEVLRQHEAEAQRIVSLYETNRYPLHEQGQEGARKKLATIQAHIAEPRRAFYLA